MYPIKIFLGQLSFSVDFSVSTSTGPELVSLDLLCCINSSTILSSQVQCMCKQSETILCF